MTIFKESIRAGVRWEQGVDGVHWVTAGDEVLVETSVDTLAQLTYEDALDERAPAKSMRAKSRAHYDFERARWDGFGVRSTKNKGKGGRGGRGGV